MSSGAPRYKMTVESTSSDPHEAGEIDLEVLQSGLRIRYSGEKEWKEIAWHEIAFCADAHTRKLSEELQWMREKAQSEGYEDGFKNGSKEKMLQAQQLKQSMKLIKMPEIERGK